MLNRIRVVGQRIHGLFSRRRLDEEFQQELDSHLEMLIEENLRRGLSPEESRRMARVQLGGITQLREIHREMWGLPWLETLLQDLRYGLRQLRRKPGFTAVAVLTLALGIGGATAIFSVVYGVLLNPLPYTDSQRLAILISGDAKHPSDGYYAYVSPAEFLDYREQNHVFDQVFGGTYDFVPLIERNLPKMVKVARVTGNFLQAVGARALVGRTISPTDCKPGAPPVAVLTYKTWTSMFNRDPKAVGRTLILDDRPTTIIGVTPPRFVPFGAEVILPQVLSHAMTSNREFYVDVIGHLKQGVTFQQANADITMLARRFARIYPKDHPKEITFTAEPFVGMLLMPKERETILVLMGGVGLLLLIACVNIANLLLARASARRHEIAIRAALGAGRPRLVRQFWLESLLLAAAGGAAGCLLAWSGLNYLVGIMPPWYIPSQAVIRINFQVLAFTAGVAVVSTLLFGLAPALLAARKDLQTALSVSGRVGGESGGRHLLRNPLVVSEVALSLVLLTGGGMLFRSFWTLELINLGYNTSNVLRVGTTLPTDRYKTVEERNRFYTDVLQRVRALPGVVSAAVFWPVIQYATSAQIELVGQSSRGSQTVWISVASDRFFKTLGIPLLAGRTISEANMVQHRHVIVVNRAFVNKYFEGANPLGQQINLKRPDWFPNLKETRFEIVGVVGDAAHTDDTEPTFKAQIFLPFSLLGTAWGTFVVRTAGNSPVLTNTLRKAFAAVDKGVAADVAPLGDDLQVFYVGPRFVVGMLTGFALLGMVLACIGVYGVLSYAVSQRTQEFGIRMALGAQVSDVRAMVLMWGLRWLAIGIGIGIPASIALEKIFQNRIWGIKSADPLTLIAVSLVLIAVGLVACYIPARRASKVDPMVALRYE